MYKYSQETINTVRAAYTAERAVHDLGIPSNGRGSILCPLHNDGHFGSCNFNRKDGTYVCYVCHKALDGPKLLEAVKGCSFIESIELAAAEAGVAIEPTQEWEQSRIDWKKSHGYKVNADEERRARKAPKVYPRLKEADAESLGIAYDNMQIRLFDNIDLYRGENTEEDTNDEGVYVTYTNISNPSRNMCQEDPEAYACIVYGKCQAKLEYLRNKRAEIIKSLILRANFEKMPQDNDAIIKIVNDYCDQQYPEFDILIKRFELIRELFQAVYNQSQAAGRLKECGIIKMPYDREEAQSLLRQIKNTKKEEMYEYIERHLNDYFKLSDDIQRLYAQYTNL